MAKAQSNGIKIEYETFGNPSSPALLLISGLGMQLIAWESTLCQKIADQGYYVIRFDNRDSGLSSKCDELSMADATKKIFALLMGQRESVPYTIDDMADDAAGLLDTLNISRVHLCGISMGGFIAQALAIKHPGQVLTLTSVYSHTGKNGAFPPAKEAMDAMLTPAPVERDGYINHMVNFFKLVYGNGLPFDEKFHRNLAGLSYDRSFYPEGVARQYLAIMTQQDRSSNLNKIRIPALVIHGDDDLLVPLSGGMATAESIPGSQLKIIRGMGHAMPACNSWWLNISEMILSHIEGSAKSVNFFDSTKGESL